MNESPALKMVREQIEARGISSPRVLDAMRSVPRHLFVPEELRNHAYEDRPLPIGYGQTISQPYMVAAVCEYLEVTPRSAVLEVGTGSGYQAAILGVLSSRVVTVEIVEPLFLRAERLLSRLGYSSVRCLLGDGAFGAPERAPFDAIVLAAATRQLPGAVLEQLSEGGVLLYPEGAPSGYQKLVRLVKKGGGIERTELMSVRFVPLTGRSGP